MINLSLRIDKLLESPILHTLALMYIHTYKAIVCVCVCVRACVCVCVRACVCVYSIRTCILPICILQPAYLGT